MASSDRSPPATTAGMASNSVAALLGATTSALLTAVVTLFLVRALDRPEYGLFALALSIHQVWILVSELGITLTGSREIARARAQTAQHVAAAATTALVVKVVTATVAGLALAAMAASLAHAFEAPDLAPLLRVTGAAMAVCSIFQLLRFGLNALGSAWLMCLLMVAESVVEAGAVVGLVLLIGSPEAAMGGRIAGYALGCALGVFLAARLLERRARPSRALAGRLLRSGPVVGVAEAAYVLFTQIDILIIGLLLDSVSVAAFEAPLRILVVAGFVGYAVATALAPRLASASDLADARQRFERSLRWTAAMQALSLPVFVALVPTNARVILGDAYVEAERLLIELAPYFYLAGLAPLVSVAALYMGAGLRRLVPATVALTLNAALDILFVERFGIHAAALATDLAMLLYVVLMLRMCVDLLGMAGRPAARTALGSGLITAAAATLAYGATTVDPTAGLLAAVLGAGAALMGLLAAGILQPEDARRLRRLPRGS